MRRFWFWFKMNWLPVLIILLGWVFIFMLASAVAHG